MKFSIYSTAQSKQVAYEYKDPFAADQFVVAHVDKGVCCRPNCVTGSAEPKANCLQYYDTLENAMSEGYRPCHLCFPNMSSHILSDGGYVAVDLDLLVKTVQHVNRQINFIPPLLTEDADKADLMHREIWSSTNQALKSRLLLGTSSHSGSGPMSSGDKAIINPSCPDAIAMTKNELDRLKLIDLACRHIAIAASTTIPEVCQLSPCSSGRHRGVSKRRRRGGVLGFKELAAMSNLSPWHFHRVFKSVTGMTPKNYGDYCCDYLKSKGRSPRGKRVIVVACCVANPTLSDADEDNESVVRATSSSLGNSHLESQQSSPQSLRSPMSGARSASASPSIRGPMQLHSKYASSKPQSISMSRGSSNSRGHSTRSTTTQEGSSYTGPVSPTEYVPVAQYVPTLNSSASPNKYPQQPSVGSLPTQLLLKNRSDPLSRSKLAADTFGLPFSYYGKEFYFGEESYPHRKHNRSSGLLSTPEAIDSDYMQSASESIANYNQTQPWFPELDIALPDNNNASTSQMPFKELNSTINFAELLTVAPPSTDASDIEFDDHDSKYQPQFSLLGTI